MTPHARTLYTGKVRTRGGRDGVSVSYTHLTLPTIYSV